MAYTETVHTSYGGNLKKGFGGIFTGIILFIAATVLLWWNEGRAVKTAKAIDETEESCQDMTDISKVNPDFEGVVVHATGKTATKDSLVDDAFGFGVNAVSLSRKVEYYQYEQHEKKETKKNVGGSTDEVITYTYSTDWVSSPINSSDFKDPQYQGRNYTLAEFESESFYATDVDFGAYKLNESQIRQMSGGQDVDLSAIPEEKLTSWNSQTANTARSHGQSVSNNVVASNDSTSAGNKYSMVHVDGSTIYFGANPNSPQVGDVKVTFKKVMPTTVSLIAKVQGNTFVANKAKNGKSFSRLEMGTKSSEEMFEGARDENSMMTWALRLLGIILVVAGLRSMFGILVNILNVIPALGSVANLGINLVTGVIGVVWSLIIIALAWIFYRPILGIAILAVVGALTFYLIKRNKEKKAAEQLQAQAAPQQPYAAQPQAAPQQPYAPQQDAPQQPFNGQPQQPQNPNGEAPQV